MKILPLIVMVACIVCGVVARAQDDAEGRPAPSRGLLKRGLLAKGKQTTTTTTPPPQEEAEYEEEYAEGEGEAAEASTEAPPSSTEGKKLVAGGVRPFRSNTDLLETLKRRRAQAAEAKLHGHSSSAAVAAPAHANDAPSEPAAPAKSSYIPARLGRKLALQQTTVTASTVTSSPPYSSSTKHGRRRTTTISPYTTDKDEPIEPTVETRYVKRKTHGKSRPVVTVYETPHATTQKKGQRIENTGKKRYNTVPKEVQNEEAPAPAKPTRGRFGRPASRSIQEDHEEQNESAPAPIRTGRTFPRRGGN